MSRESSESHSEPPAAGPASGDLGRPLPPSGRWRTLFGIDPRSLALFRIGLGVMLLADLIKRSLTFVEHYTGQGVFPREAALVLRPAATWLHLYLLSDSAGVQGALFGLQALLALCILVGWRTRLASVLAFYMWSALMRRNPFALHTGDVYLQALLLWSVFLPLNARASLDRRAGRAPALADGPYLSFGSLAVLLQIAVFYFSAGYLKHQHAPWLEGNALWIFTQIQEYTRPFGVLLGEVPRLCAVLTFATLFLEGVGPILLFFPWWNAWIRVVLILLLSGFHLAIQLSVYIGIFEILSIVALALFLPTQVWDLLERWSHGRRWAGLLRPFTVGEDERRVSPRSPWATWLPGVVLVPALALMLVGNLNSYAREDPALPLPEPVDRLVRPLGLVQNWDIFTDLENQFVGWFLVVGQQADGRLVDVIYRRPFDGIVEPVRFASVFTNHNQRRFWRQMTLEANAYALPGFLAYLARRWEQEQGSKLPRIAFWYVGKNALQRQPDYEARFIGALGSGGPEGELADPFQARLRREWQDFLGNFPRRFRVSDPEAVELAERVEARMGGREAWDGARHLHWTYDGEREHCWDKGSDDVRIRSGELLVLMNLRSGTGRAFRAGREVDPVEREALLTQGRAWWNNDSYWAFMPWKLRDPGVTLTYRGLVAGLPGGLEAEALELSFAGVGLTSRNRFVVYVGRESGLVEYWSFFPDARSSQPAFTSRWGEWRPVGDLWLATRGGKEQDLGLGVAAEAPPALYRDPACDPATVPWQTP